MTDTARPFKARLTRTTNLLSVGATACGVSVAVGPVVRRVLLKQGILDNPSARSSHSAPVPRGGGWLVLASTAAGCAVGRIVGFSVPWKTVGGAVVLSLVGFADDRWSVSAGPRLAAQVGVGVASDLASGLWPLGSATVPTLVNVVNFMDGINGITSLTTIVWGVNAAVVGVATQNPHVAICGAALAGGAAGFLPHNIRRDKMFLGDVGSYFIGSAIALSALYPSLSLRSRLAVLAPLVPYLADTGSTLIMRARRGEKLTEAHRDHAYQRLANERRWGHLRVAGLYAAGAAIVATVATRVLVCR